jgi:hypothetical protein
MKWIYSFRINLLYPEKSDIIIAKDIGVKGKGEK